MKRILLAVVVLSFIQIPLVAAQADEPYNNTTVDAETGPWLEGVDEVSFETVAQMISRIGAFVVGTDPSDPGLSPLVSSIIVAGVVIGAAGTSRAGIVASGVLGISTLAVLSISAGILPTWIYGLGVIAVAALAVSVIIRLLR